MILAHLLLAKIKRRKGKNKEQIKSQVSVLGYTKEDSNSSSLQGEASISSFTSQPKEKAKPETQHRYHGRKVTAPTTWPPLRAVHHSATNICSWQKSEEGEPRQVRHLSEDTWAPKEMSTPSPCHSSSSLSSPSSKGTGPILPPLHFHLQREKNTVVCDWSFAFSPFSLLPMQSFSQSLSNCLKIYLKSPFTVIWNSF